MSNEKKKDDAIATVDHAYPAISNRQVCDLVEQTIEGTGVTPFQLAQIRLPTGGGLAWTIDLGEGPEACGEFLGVIGLVKAKQRAWFRQPFADSGGGSPPECTSSDGINGYGVNDPDSPPDAPSSTHACNACEWNMFGSKRGAGKGKDCGEVMHLYIWLEGEALPAVLQVPPTSLAAVQGYMIKLASKFKTPASVMTRFSLKVRSGKGVPDSSTLVLSIDRPLSEAEEENMSTIAAKMTSLVPTLYPVVATDASVDPSASGAV